MNSRGDFNAVAHTDPLPPALSSVSMFFVFPFILLFFVSFVSSFWFCLCLFVSCSMALYLPVGFGYFGVVFVIIDFGAIF